MKLIIYPRDNPRLHMRKENRIEIPKASKYFATCKFKVDISSILMQFNRHRWIRNLNIINQDRPCTIYFLSRSLIDSTPYNSHPHRHTIIQMNPKPIE